MLGKNKKLQEDSACKAFLEELNRKDFDFLDEKNQENQYFKEDECDCSLKGKDIKEKWYY